MSFPFRACSVAAQPPAIAVAAERNVELATDLGDEVRREEVVLDARDALAVDVHAVDGADGLAVLVRVPEQAQRLAAMQPELAARWRRQHALHEARFHAAELVGLGHAFAAEEHALEDTPLATVLGAGADDVHGGAVEQQRGQTPDVARVERFAEGVEHGGDGGVRAFGLGLDQLASTAMERGLYRARGRRERLADLLER